MFIDTHTHLNFEKFADDRDDVIKRAIDAGVKAMICPSSNLENSRLAVEIANVHPEVFAAIGFHPIHIKDERFSLGDYQKLLNSKKVVAVGETGLDYYYDSSTAEGQKEIFRSLIGLAQKYHRPLIIHSRNAGDDVLSILMEQDDIKGVLHCFEGNWAYAKVILNMGLFISFTGLITFSKNKDTIEVIENVPLERLMIETDSPLLAPEPYRGKRNEPAYVIEVAKKIAEIKKIPLEKVAEETSKNAIKLFKLN